MQGGRQASKRGERRRCHVVGSFAAGGFKRKGYPLRHAARGRGSALQCTPSGSNKTVCMHVLVLSVHACACMHILSAPGSQ